MVAAVPGVADAQEALAPAWAFFGVQGSHQAQACAGASHGGYLVIAATGTVNPTGAASVPHPPLR